MVSSSAWFQHLTSRCGWSSEQFAVAVREAGIAAAEAVLGARWTFESSYDESSQALEVSMVVPCTAENLSAIRMLDEGASVGDEVELIVAGHPDAPPVPEDRVVALCGEPLPTWRMAEQIDLELCRRFDAHAVPLEFGEGTLGAALMAGGEIFRGLKAEVDGQIVAIEHATLSRYSIRPSIAGHCLEVGVRRNGTVETFRTIDQNGFKLGASLEFYLDPDAVDPITSAWRMAAPTLRHPGPFPWQVLWAGVRLNRPGTRWTWFAQEALPAMVSALDGTTIDHREGPMRLSVGGAVLDEDSALPGSAYLTDVKLNGEAVQSPAFALPLGLVRPAATIERVSQRVRDQLPRITETYVDAVVAWLRDAPLDILRGDPRSAAPPFRPVTALERVSQEGSAPPPPTPLRDPERVARGAQQVRAVERSEHDGATANILAAFQIGEWTVELRDDLERWPFAAAEIVLSGGGDQVLILCTDVWAPPSRRVIDGDAYAFRCWCVWLREVLDEAGLDRTVRFQNRNDEEEDEEDENEPDEIRIRDWLRFGVPETFAYVSLDWRVDDVPAWSGARVSDWEIWGWTPESVDHFEGRGLQMYRAFLAECLGVG